MTTWKGTRPGGTVWRSAAPAATRHRGVAPPPPVGREYRDVAYAGAGVLSVTSAVVPARFPDFAGAGALSVASLPVFVRAGDLSATGVLSFAASARYDVAAALTGGGTLSVVAQLAGEMIPVDVALSGGGALSAVSLLRMGPYPADFAGAGTLSAQAFPRHTRTGDLAGTGTLSVTGFPSHTRTAAYAGGGTLSVAAQVAPQPTVGFTGGGTLSVAVAVGVQRTADFAGAGTLAVLSLPRHDRTADFAGAGTLSVVALQKNGAPFAGGGTLSVLAAQKADWWDNFTRSNGAIGSNWTTFGLGPDTTVVPEIESNMMRAKATATNNQSNPCFALATATAAQCATDNMGASGVIVGTLNGLRHGPIVRASADGQNLVAAFITTDSASTGIWTRIAGTWTRRVSTSTSTFVNIDTFELRASGNVYTLAKNPTGLNTTVATWTDSGNLCAVGPSNRYCGMYHHSNKDAGGTVTYAPHIDDVHIRDL